MVVTSTRLGKVLPGSKPRTGSGDGEFVFTPTGDITLVDDSSGGSGSSALSGQAALNRAALEKTKYQNELKAAADTLLRQQTGAGLQAAYLTNQLGAGIPSALSQQIDLQQSTGEQYISDQAAELLKQLNARQTQATDLTRTGFTNLQNYLAQNQPTAFAQAQRQQPTPMTSDVMQYLAGQGVSGAPVQAQVDLANLGAQGGASNYNQLLNVLAAREQAGQQSRQAEAQMGLTSQLANLQGIYGQGTSQLEQSRLAALADLASKVSGNRIAATQASTSRDQAIKDALAALIGTGNLSPSNPDPAIQDLLTKLIPGYPADEGITFPTTGGGTTQQPPAAGVANSPAVMALLNTTAAKRTDKPTAVTNRIYNFVEENPKATKAQVLAEFPNLQGLAKLKAKKK
jgi:hypothetical protein